MRKKWVIADIHGCFESLVSLFENYILPSRNDELIFLGDYIDRGPNVKGVIDFIIKLKIKGYQVKTLRGNHEDVLLRCYEIEKNNVFQANANDLKERWYFHGGKSTLESFKVNAVDEIPSQYIRFFQELPHYYVSGEYVFVHAGLNFALENPFEDTNSMMWAKSFEVDPQKIGNRKVVHGHVPTMLEDIQTQLHQGKAAISLDNGCVYPKKDGMGNLLALEMSRQELVVQPNTDFGYEKLKILKAVA